MPGLELVGTLCDVLPDGALTWGVGGAIIGVVVVLVVVGWVLTSRKKAARLNMFRASCRALGLVRREDGWFGEHDGVRVRVRWSRPIVQFGPTFYSDCFTSYCAFLDPPLSTGVVLYTGVERHRRWGREVHLASVEYWNELPLPTGGRLRDVLDAPDRASVAHVEIPHEALTALACVYGSQPDPARRLLQGALADTLVGIAQAPVFLWLDDSHVEVLSKQTVTRDRYLRRTWDRDEWGAYEAAAIAKGLDRVVTLAKELRRSAS